MSRYTSMARRVAISLLAAATAQAVGGGAAARSQPATRELLARGAVAALSDPDPDVRWRALLRLGELQDLGTAEAIAGFLDPGHSATERFHALRAYASLHVQDQRHLDVIATFLDDPKRPSDGASQPQLLDPEIVGPAVEALSAMRVAYQFAPRLRRLLECQTGASASLDSTTDRTAGNSRCALAAGVICGLAAGGSPLEDYKPQVVAFLRNSSARASVVRALAAAKQTPAFLPQIASILNETGQPWNREDFLAALQAVSSLGRAREFLPRITWALQQDDFDLKGEAIRTIELANLDQEFHPAIVSMLKDPKALTRFAAVQGIAFGNRAESYAAALRDSMSVAIPKDNRELQWYCSALRALAETGRQEFKSLIVSALSPAGSPIVGGAAIEGLERAGAIGRYREHIDKLLIRDPPYAPGPLLQAFQMQSCNLEEQLELAGSLDSRLGDLASYKLTISSCSGGGDDARLLLALIPGDPQKLGEPLTEEGDRRAVFKILSRLAARPGLPARLRDRVAWGLAKLPVSWNAGDLDDLRAAHQTLARGLRAQAEALQSTIDQLEEKQWSHRLTRWGAKTVLILAVHLCLWLILLWLYPRFKMIQAIVLWDRRLTKILTLFYFDYALILSPILRHRLLKPFRGLLLGSHLDGFNDSTYFTKSRVREKATGKDLLITELQTELPKRKTIVLYGERGLGKTMFLCHLAATATAIPIFLDAPSCAGGVLESIRGRLKGFVSEDSYVNRLIWGGAVEIYIDRLDAAPETTQEKIRMFMENNSEANMVVTARPPLPSAATPLEHVFELQPLLPSERMVFLERRQALAPPAETRKLVKECERYIEGRLEPTQSPTVLAWTERFLCNPKNLDALATALKAGAPPDHLIDLAPEA
jgi:hypothetical protein